MTNVDITTAIENSRTWHDLNSLSQLRGHGDSPEAIREAAKQFESVFYGMMMKSMREASEALIEEPMFDSPGLDLFQDMYDKQLSLSMGSANMEGKETTHLGLADILVAQLTRNRSNTPGDNKEAQATQDFRRQNRAVEAPTAPVVGKVPEIAPVTNESAIELKGMDFSSPAAFVSSLLPYAKRYAEKLNLDPKLLLAQAALETGWGKFVMRTVDGISSHNLFGIKSDKSWDGDSTTVKTLEFESGQLQQKTADFRAYDSHEQSFADYVQFISNKPRYQKAVESADQATHYINELQAAGYATDPEYANKIKQIYRSDTLNDAVHTAVQFME